MSDSNCALCGAAVIGACGTCKAVVCPVRFGWCEPTAGQIGTREEEAALKTPEQRKSVSDSSPYPDRTPHGFCVNAGSMCNMQYCDENGCIDRPRQGSPASMQEAINASFVRHASAHAGAIPSRAELDEARAADTPAGWVMLGQATARPTAHYFGRGVNFPACGEGFVIPAATVRAATVPIGAPFWCQKCAEAAGVRVAPTRAGLDAAKIAEGFALIEVASARTEAHALAVEEWDKINRRFGPDFSSPHELLGVLLEEFEEFKQAIYANDTEAVIAELPQVAAVALRGLAYFLRLRAAGAPKRF